MSVIDTQNKEDQASALAENAVWQCILLKLAHARSEHEEKHMNVYRMIKALIPVQEITHHHAGKAEYLDAAGPSGFVQFKDSNAKIYVQCCQKGEKTWWSSKIGIGGRTCLYTNDKDITRAMETLNENGQALEALEELANLHKSIYDKTKDGNLPDSKEIEDEITYYA